VPIYAEFELRPDIIENADALSTEIASIYDNLRESEGFSCTHAAQKSVDPPELKRSSKDAPMISPPGIEHCLHCTFCVSDDDVSDSNVLHRALFWDFQ
jgi:hypothetical protein